jgi:hypothetical protein
MAADSPNSGEITRISALMEDREVLAILAHLELRVIALGYLRRRTPVIPCRLPVWLMSYICALDLVDCRHIYAFAA